MKKLKKIGIIFLSGLFVFSSSNYSFGKDYIKSESIIQEGQISNIETYINYNDTTNLKFLDTWYDIISDTPFILLDDVYVTVTNHANNPGDISVRFVNSKGNIIGTSEQTITAGSKAKFLATGGTEYTVQAKAISKTGQYKIAVKD